jgi:hypothetical protein
MNLKSQKFHLHFGLEKPVRILQLTDVHLSLADDIVGIDGAFVFQCLDARGDGIGNTVKIAVGNGFGPLYSGTAAQRQ